MKKCERFCLCEHALTCGAPPGTENIRLNPTNEAVHAYAQNSVNTAIYYFTVLTDFEHHTVKENNRINRFKRTVLPFRNQRQNFISYACNHVFRRRYAVYILHCRGNVGIAHAFRVKSDYLIFDVLAFGLISAICFGCRRRRRETGHFEQEKSKIGFANFYKTFLAD